MQNAGGGAGARAVQRGRPAAVDLGQEAAAHAAASSGRRIGPDGSAATAYALRSVRLVEQCGGARDAGLVDPGDDPQRLLVRAA